jgi:hypothetical protein
MRKLMWAPVLAWMIGHATAGYAEGSGHDLLRHCKQAVNAIGGIVEPETIDFMAAGQCMGLVDGFAGAAAFYESQPGAPEAICFPDDMMTLGESVRLVTQYLENNPQQLHEAATVLVFGAFLASYPCP